MARKVKASIINRQTGETISSNAVPFPEDANPLELGAQAARGLNGGRNLGPAGGNPNALLVEVVDE